MKLTKNVGPNKCGYNGYDIGFGACPQYSLNGEWDENFMILT